MPHNHKKKQTDFVNLYLARNQKQFFTDCRKLKKRKQIKVVL